MKKKLIIALATVLIVGQATVSTTVFAESNKKSVETISETQKQEYPNKITVRGLGLEGHAYRGADIGLNTETKKFEVSGMSGTAYRIHYRFGDNKYFTLKLYDAYGNLKKELDLKGVDKVNKLNELNDVSFEYGDFIRLYHAESKDRLGITGDMVHRLYPTLYKWVLEQNIYQITEAGLKEVYDYEGRRISDAKESYWDDTYDNSTFTLNAKFGIIEPNKTSKTFDSSYNSTLVIKKDGSEVVKTPGYALNWFSEDPNNYNGAQFVLTKDVFEHLDEGKYTFVTRIEKDGRTIANIDLVQNENRNPFSRYVVNTNINDNGTQIIGDKAYTFTTEYSRTGQITLEVKNVNSQN